MQYLTTLYSLIRNNYKVTVFIIVFFFSVIIHGNTPYPIIFIHGLDSDDTKWMTTINYLEPLSGDFNEDYVFHAVLNAYDDMTNIFGPDGLEGTFDDDVLVSFDNEDNELPDGNIYTINFDNFWNENSTNPKIETYNSEAPGILGYGESVSNQSSIYKQGYALKKCIQAVLGATSADKVILVGHSMGGLTAREYLQRQENGQHKWWIDPNSPEGHKVAKLVTIGTPHLGSNFAEWPSNMTADTIGIESSESVFILNSEAVRDLRYNYNSFGLQGRYLFGGDESTSDLFTLGYHNFDVNCDGDESDIIVGLNDGEDGTFDNHLMPLPTINISYSWITSDIGTSGDFIVDLSRQWLTRDGIAASPSGIADTLLTNRVHTDEASDYYSIIRGLDEPDQYVSAYEVKSDGTIYLGFSTYQPNMFETDTDWYKFQANSSGSATLALNNMPDQNGWQLSIYAYNEDTNELGQLLAQLDDDDPTTYVSFDVLNTKYYYCNFTFSGPATNPYYYYINIVEPAAPYLYAGSVNPYNGATEDTYEFTVNYISTQNLEPNSINLITEGNSYQMTANGDNWVQGVEFAISLNFSNPNLYTYHFEGTTQNGDQLRYPVNGSLEFTVNQSSTGWEIELVETGTSITSPSNIDPGDNIIVQVQVHNTGNNIYYSLPVEVKLFSPDGIVLDQISSFISEILPNHVENIQLLLTLPTNVSNGVYTIDCNINPELDTDWTNNYTSLTFYVGPNVQSNIYLVEDFIFVNVNNIPFLFYPGGLKFKLWGGTDDAMFVKDNNNDDEDVHVYEIDFFDNNTFVALDMPSTTGFGFAYGYEVDTNIPFFNEVELQGYRGSVVQFEAQAPGNYEFINSDDNYDFFTSTEDNQLPEPADWFLGEQDINEDDSHVYFEFQVPSDAVFGIYLFFFYIEYSNSDVRHIVRLKITVVETPPTITELSDIQFSADDTLTITGNDFTDNGDVIFDEILCSSDNIISWSNSLIELIVPVGLESGQLRVVTQHGLSNGIQYTIISSTGAPELVSPIPDQVLTAGDTLFVGNLNQLFYDPNGDLLVFSLAFDDTLLNYLAEELNNGLLFLSYPENLNEVVIVSVICTDITNKSVSDTFNVQVMDINDPPIILPPDDHTILEDDTLLLLFSYLEELVSDIDNNYADLDISIESNDSTLFIPIELGFNIIPPINWNGSITIFIHVNDGQYLVTQSFILIVQPINDAPFFYSSFPDTITIESTTTDTIQFAQLFGDVDNSYPQLNINVLYDSLVTAEIVDTSTIILLQSNEELFGYELITITVADSQYTTEKEYTVHIPTLNIEDTNISGIPTTYLLFDNYPNPFNPATSIRYNIPKQTKVNIIIYDLLGNQVITLVNTVQEPGYKKVTWHGVSNSNQPVSSGMYFYQIRAGHFVQIKKMVLLK